MFRAGKGAKDSITIVKLEKREWKRVEKGSARILYEKICEQK